MIECDIKRCVGCRMCEVTCSSFHFGAVSPVLARIRVAKLEETGIDMAVACLSCAEKPCLACPADALSVGAQGEILLDAERCDTCKTCAEACPIGAVGFYEDRPLFCDLCGGAVACVDACPSRALSYLEAYREIPLKAFLLSTGNPNQRRAGYVGAQGEPLRASWKNGARVDS
ncbi:MAG: 4Fe-4S dicluster domain-containing protein [Acidobacteriia bacterium]|nr:4Fe-4S dicluster domain-containing protein [Terriglobia bacterium]